MWQKLRPVLLSAKLDPVRVENPIHPGTPDVNLCTGAWIELKCLACWPVRASTVVRIPLPRERSQLESSMSDRFAISRPQTSLATGKATSARGAFFASGVIWRDLDRCPDRCQRHTRGGCSVSFEVARQTPLISTDDEELWLGLCAYSTLNMAKALQSAERMRS